MKRRAIFRIVLVVVVVLAIGIIYVVTRPRVSKPAVATFESNEQKIQVKYAQPNKKGREIFGALVPYNKVWRTGANEATQITFAKDAKIAGKNIKAGTYSFFTIPNPQEWTIILNSEAKQWGAFFYDEAKDVLRAKVKPENQSQVTESFTIQFKKNDTQMNMQLMWDKTLVNVPIE